VRFLLTRDWPVGSNGGTRLDLTVPAGTQIDSNFPTYCGVRLPSVMPINAQALDEDALNALKAWYPSAEEQRYFVAPGRRGLIGPPGAGDLLADNQSRLDPHRPRRRPACAADRPLAISTFYRN
jgi:hypothetical protein